MNVALTGVRHFVLAASTISGLMAGAAVLLSADPVQADTATGTAADTPVSRAARQKADEIEMLARARRERDESRSARERDESRSARERDESRSARERDETRLGRELDETKISRRLEGTVEPGPAAEPTSRVVNIGQPAPADQEALARKRQDELQRLSDKIRRVSQARASQPNLSANLPVVTPWTTEVTAAVPPTNLQPLGRSALGAPIDKRDLTDTRAAVLLVMTPGSRGIRRFEKTADPILCAADGCYVSNGAGVPAQFFTLGRSMGVANTLGQRAGACRQNTGCVFRGVDVSDPQAFVQPVDLRLVHHDRREMKRATIDTSCRVDSGRLACNNPIRGDDFTIWIVPESVAALAGSALLARAVENGLPPANTTALKE